MINSDDNQNFLKSPQITRYPLLDFIRGINVISMVIYHGIWDLVYIFGVDLKWYKSDIGYVWQQGICWLFILLSGFCFSLGKTRLKRAVTVFLGGVLVTVITNIFMPSNRIMFGILTLLGSCMFIMIFLDKHLKKLNPYIGLSISFLIFLFTRNVNNGFLGFESFNIASLPSDWYSNNVSAFIGFPYFSFRSTDYFSLIPWVFLFISGYFLYHIFLRRSQFKCLEIKTIGILEWIGKHSLLIYLLHQPVIYFVLNFLG